MEQPPEQFIAEAIIAMPKLSSTEAFRMFEYASAKAIVFYNGAVPPQTTTQLHELVLACLECLIMHADG